MQTEHYSPKTIAKKGVVIDGETLTMDEMIAVARYGAEVTINPSIRKKIQRSRDYVEQAVEKVVDSNLTEEEKRPWLIYGVTTGFGSHKDFIIQSREEAKVLQRNIILSHACGVGQTLDSETVRAMMLLRLNSFAKGFSGVRYCLLELLVLMLNHHIHPIVPEKGSVGSSGDLCPLAHMALVLIGRGEGRIDQCDPIKGDWETLRCIPGEEAIAVIHSEMQDQNIPYPFTLSYKEGLALTNGANVMTSIGVMAYSDSFNLLRNSDIAGAMTLEAIGGRTRAFDPKVHAVRPHKGQVACAENIRRLTQDSTLLDTSRDVHDSYSVRCMPQVHGASDDAMDYVKRVVEIEVNSATDNPLFFEPDPPPQDGADDLLAYSAGNYHGQPVAIAMDFLGLAIAELASISERRIQKLLDKHHNQGLNPDLCLDPRLHSGLMIAHYTAAALVSENKVYCHPASCDSIPTSSNIEDHVSMGTFAARKARMILENAKNVIAIEMLCAAQALDFRVGMLKQADVNSVTGKPGKGTMTAFRIIREAGVNPLKEDREIYPDIAKVRTLIEYRHIIDVVEAEVGELYRYK
ncbi:histidine ammonia-lyase [candidate division KSB1 bacterium]|nr:histidine ammonia-lyase [candidate division KSB1 bacterium]